MSFWVSRCVRNLSDRLNGTRQRAELCAFQHGVESHL
jgi:hypothetical protein